jgi:hypothetical protein
MEKELFVIDGYKIWAISYEEALEYYNMLLKSFKFNING